MGTIWSRIGVFLVAGGVVAGCMNPFGNAPRKDEPPYSSTGLPVISVRTEAMLPVDSKETYLDAEITVTDVVTAGSDGLRLSHSGEIRGRGNSTWTFPKKPYRIKFTEKVSLFGLEPAKSWALLANYLDPTLIMNTVAFELGKRFDLPFTHSAIHVELVLNGVHRGSYVLTEHKQVGKGRVDIDEENGFLIELDSYFDEEPKFRTGAYDLPVLIKSPEGRGDGSSEGYAFVRDAVGRLEALLYNDGSDAPDPDYHDLVDLQSFVDFLMIHALTGNNEIAHPKSTHMYMDADSVIRMGPLWDFDWGYGIGAEFGDGYFIAPRTPSGRHPFFNRFFDDPEFVSLYRQTWNRMKPEIDDMEDFIAAKGLELAASRKLDAAIWTGSPNFSNMAPGDTLDFTNEIARMRSWWRDRVGYLAEKINGM